MKDEIPRTRRPFGLGAVRRFLDTRIGKSTLILPAVFVFSTAIGMVFFSMVFFARDVFSAPVALIGWLAALPFLCYFCGCFLFQPLSRRLLPRHSLLIATGTAAALVAGTLLNRSLPLLFVLYGLFGLSTALFWPPLMGWLSAGKESRSLNTALSRFNLSWSTGNIIGPFLAGSLLRYRIGLPFLLSALLMSAVGLLAAGASLLIPAIRSDRHREPARTREGSTPDRSTALRFPAWIGLFTTYLVFGVLISVFPLFLREELGVPENRIGLILLLRALLTTAGFLLLGRLTFWHFKGWVMLLNQALLIALTAFMAALRSVPLLAAAVALFGVLFSLSYSNSLFHGVAGSPYRARRMAIHEGLLTAGIMVGSSVGGSLYQGSGSFSVAFLFCSALAAAGGLAQLALALIDRRRAGS